ILVLEGEHAAVRVVDEHDLLGREQALRYRKRSDRILGGRTARVADDVRVALLQAQDLVHVEPRVHAGEYRHVLGRGQGKVALLERTDIGVVVADELIGNAHACLLRIGVSAVEAVVTGLTTEAAGAAGMIDRASPREDANGHRSAHSPFSLAASGVQAPRGGFPGAGWCGTMSTSISFGLGGKPCRNIWT